MRYARTFLATLSLALGAAGVSSSVAPALQDHWSVILTPEDHIIIIFDEGEIVI